jgi:hypothetical protein
MNTNYKHNSVKAQKVTNCIVYFADTYHISYHMSFKIKLFLSNSLTNRSQGALENLLREKTKGENFSMLMFIDIHLTQYEQT